MTYNVIRGLQCTKLMLTSSFPVGLAISYFPSALQIPLEDSSKYERCILDNCNRKASYMYMYATVYMYLVSLLPST